MIVHHARWVLPIARPPIRDGWVAVDRGRIAAVGGPGDPMPASEHTGTPADSARVLLPGLVNAHTHLELSWMRGRIPPAGAMPVWVERLLALRQAGTSDAITPILDAIAEARATGTALVGDITNTLASYRPLADSGMSGIVFRELLGFNAADPEAVVAGASAEIAALEPCDRLRCAVVPHAPYSVSPALFRAIEAASQGRPMSVHLGESAEEVRFLREGGGPWVDLLQRLGVWTPEWMAPACGAVEYLDRLGYVNDRLLAVHGVQFSAPEIDRLAAAGATIVSCPRSNRRVGAGDPDIAGFYRSGVRLAFGTDSLASVDDLNLFAELAAARRLARDVPASRILKSATLDGAVALGFGSELGSLEPGKRAEILSVPLPDTVADVEEYLLGGIAAGDIEWIAGAAPRRS